MILEINHLTKSFGQTKVLEDVNLSIDHPRLIALIAPNGTGKTTLLNIICHLEKQDIGEIYLSDRPNTEMEIFQEMTYMQDNSILYPNLTGWDHIQLVQSLHHVFDQQVQAVLSELRMTNYVKRKVKTYSLGMKQHLLFALSILPNPQILLMDEPLNGLDPASVMRVRTILTRLHQKGTTIVFSSHNLDQIDKLTKDIYFLKNRQLLSLEKILQAETSKTYQVVVNNPEFLVTYLTNQSITFTQLAKYKYQFICSQKEMDILRQQTDIQLLDWVLIETNLETIYFDLYEDYTYDNT